MLEIRGLNNKNMLLRTGYVLLLVALGFMPLTSVSAQETYEPVRFSVSNFLIQGDNPIGEKADKVLAPYIGEQSGLEGLSAAADALEQAIIKAGFSFHRVSLPPQQLTSGTVEFKIVKFEIGVINVTGNQFFDQQNIERSLPLLQSGITPNTKALSRSLKLANNHASKNIQLRFKEGEEGDTIDADITVQDQNPQIFFVTLDNTGSGDTKEFRSTLGYQHGNLFNRDHSLTATLTIAPEDPSATTQFGLNYHMPLYEHGANLDFLLSDSEVNSSTPQVVPVGVSAGNVELNGKGQVFGVTYARPMLTNTSFNHQWSVGFQNKTFDNQISVGAPIPKIISAPLILSYGFSNSFKAASISGNLSLNANTGIGSANEDSIYDEIRSGADKSWSSVKYSFSLDRAFAEKWLFHAGLSGQNSSDLLISGEQFGAGGSGSLRGFEERSVTGDSGHQLSFEVWSPAFWGVRYLVFIDQASVEVNETPASNDGATYDLSSYGVGLRWSYKQQLSVSLDVGIINDGLGEDEGVNNNPQTEDVNIDGDTKAHFNLIYRF